MKRTSIASFPSKSLNITAIISFLQKLSTWVAAKSNISTRIGFLLLTSVIILRAITLCGAFTPDCGYDNRDIILIGDVYFPNACLQCASVCEVRNIPFEDQTNSFFLSLGPGIYISEENPKSVQDVIGDVYCPEKYCLNREKCESLRGYVTTPRSIYGSGKCGGWLFVHKVLTRYKST